jgi:NADP-dependent aldehyde dehydrogenase
MSSTSQNSVHPVLIAGGWRPAQAVGTFYATNPATKEALPDVYPVSGWQDIESALASASTAAAQLRALPDADFRLASFLENYAAAIESRATAIVAAAHAETGLAVSPRLRDVELVRTINQLRLGAAAARDGSWLHPTLDTKAGLRSCLAPIGPVWVIGPNNFPFAYNGIAGGDFAAAIAAGNPVIAKAHPLHPTTSRLLAEAAHDAATSAVLPSGTVQMLYHLNPEEGFRLVTDPRLKAVAFTGSRAGGLRLKAAADTTGTLFFGEMSSINPVLILPGALSESGPAIADQFVSSLLLATGQFCTNPGLVLLLAGTSTDTFIDSVRSKLTAAPTGTLFSQAGQESLLTSIGALRSAGAELLAGGAPAEGRGFCVQNTLLRATAKQFLANAAQLQKEAFGNAALVVVADSLEELHTLLTTLEGNLTGSIYSATTGEDDAAYQQLAPALRPRVGRFLNDKMPTGVAVSPAMNHGGPYPATSQPHFTAVGFPGAIKRFTQLESYDNVRQHRLPLCLRDKNPTGRLWRSIDGHWTLNDVSPATPEK